MLGANGPQSTPTQLTPALMFHLYKAARENCTWTAGVPPTGFVVIGECDPSLAALGGEPDQRTDVSSPLAAIATVDRTFSEQAILQTAYGAFDAMRAAWVVFHPDFSRPLLTTPLWQAQTNAIVELQQAGGRVELDELVFAPSQIVHAVSSPAEQAITVRFTGRVKTAAHHPGVHEIAFSGDFRTDVTMRRAHLGTLESGSCFNCGAPVTAAALPCTFCGATQQGAPGRWLASAVRPVYDGPSMAAVMPQLHALNRAAAIHESQTVATDGFIQPSRGGAPGFHSTMPTVSSGGIAASLLIGAAFLVMGVLITFLQRDILGLIFAVVGGFVVYLGIREVIRRTTKQKPTD